MLIPCSIQLESMFKISMHVTQDLLKNQVINPITQDVIIILDPCLESQQA